MLASDDATIAPRPDTAYPSGEAIRVRGLVQGVGFRPTVWRLARDCGLSGDVRNDGEGVRVRVWGDDAARARFVARLRNEAPPLARIDTLETTALTTPPTNRDFRIVASAGGAAQTGVVADAATCSACREESLAAGGRRQGYAFTNCTHCGPRLSITRAIPYDRRHTSMAGFAMCARCAAEYADPGDRRFHAQPNACPDCGPRLWLEAAPGAAIDIDGDPISTTRRLLAAGHVVAIKGLGGIHLAVDATQPAAIARLRARKHRYAKPFALMARDIAMIARYCRVDATAAELLRAPAAPIVLLPAEGRRLADGVAPGQVNYGFMLAYTPLHHLLMSEFDAPIVLTSGNLSDEPQCIGNDEARARLGPIADALLLHDRAIINRVDDSVVRIVAGAPTLIRRARGYAPAPLRLPTGFAEAPAVRAYGGELKNTFCLLRDGQAVVSAHLGDLENARTHAAYRHTLELYAELFEHRPARLAIDGHPDYLPSKLGREIADRDDLPLVVTQHHHAHIAACLADHGVDLDAPPVLGIALDGTGFGADGCIWGGEFLQADYRSYRRLAALACVPMPGATQAIRQPWRMAYAHLRRVSDWAALATRHADAAFFDFAARQPLASLDGMIAAGFNCPATSACGRLFDAVAAVIGIRQTAEYEAQAAIELEAAVNHTALTDGSAYPFAIVEHETIPRLEPGPMWRALLDDQRAGIPAGILAARFHAGLAQAIGGLATRLSAVHDNVWRGRIALSGGVFQNAVLTQALVADLEARGFEVLRHARVPTHDGGLSLGQAVIAAAQALNDSLSEGSAPCV